MQMGGEGIPFAFFCGRKHGRKNAANLYRHGRLYSGGHRHRPVLYEAGQQKFRKLLHWRARPGSLGGGHERRGIGYERLASDGPAGRGLLVRPGGRSLDGGRSGDWNVYQLADRGAAAAAVFCDSRGCHHDSGFLLQPLPGEEKGHHDDRGHFHSGILHGLCRKLLCHLRQALQHPVWNALSGHDDCGSSLCYPLYLPRRVPGGECFGFHAGHCHDFCPERRSHRGGFCGGRPGCGDEQHQKHSRVL